MIHAVNYYFDLFASMKPRRNAEENGYCYPRGKKAAGRASMKPRRNAEENRTIHTPVSPRRGRFNEASA